ncbi:MAG: septum formation initiator family protein [Candidatus Omnitrophica bacterium]|nr:septum formation initiator family protein [Candidatus Omnitrophota bacterium]MDD5429558.1 septum formation initiator family protein [Candidatus Omnitrophota bacterium]
MTVVYFPNYAKLRQLKLENKRLLSETEALEKEIADYQKKIGKVGKDSHLYEEIARDSLGVARDNEIVIDIKR